MGAAPALALRSPAVSEVPGGSPRPAESLPGETGSAARLPERAPKATTAAPGGSPRSGALDRAAEILRQIELHATPWVKRLTLELEPAALGRLSIQLALRAGKVTAIVRGDEPETLELLRRHEGELARVLAARGLCADAVRFEQGFSHPRRERRDPSQGAGAVPTTPPSSSSSSSSFELDTVA